MRFDFCLASSYKMILFEIWLGVNLNKYLSFGAEISTWSYIFRFKLIFFLSFRVFRQFLFIFISIFGRYIAWPSSGVFCRTWEPTRNFEPRSLSNPRGSLALIPVQVKSIPLLLLACCQDWTCNLQMIVTQKLRAPTPITVMLCVLPLV